MFNYRAIKHYKVLWMKTGIGDDAWKVWGLKLLSKQWGSVFAEKPLRKQKIISRKLSISTQSSRASSGTIYTWVRIAAQRDTSLLLLWWRSDGQDQSVSFSGTPRTGRKKCSSWTRKSSQLKNSITTRTRFMLKRPFKWFLGVQWGHHTSFVMVWCSIREFLR